MALILMYHRVAEEQCDPWSLCVSPENFAEHVTFTKKIGKPLAMKDFAARHQDGNLPQNAIAITFDDGFVDNLYKAKPILEENEVPATLFLVTEYLKRKQEFWFEELEGLLLHPGNLPHELRIDVANEQIVYDLGSTASYSQELFLKHHKWKAFETEPPTSRHHIFLELWKMIRPLKDSERRQILSELRRWTGKDFQTRSEHCAMSIEEVKRLAEGGIFEVGSHTQTHPQLSQLSSDQQMLEIAESKRFLESLISIPVRSFAYPYGWHSDYSSVSVDCVRRAGYLSACTTIPGKVHSKSNPFELNRVAVANLNRLEFEAMLKPFMVD